jgi:hypothetical protein
LRYGIGLEEKGLGEPGGLRQPKTRLNSVQDIFPE